MLPKPAPTAGHAVDGAPSLAALRRLDAGVALLVFAIAFGLFASTTGFEFLDVDDGTYVFENPIVLDGLTVHGVAHALTDFRGSTWVPTTTLSLMIDRTVHGTGPSGFHLTNALLHALNGLLLYLLLVRTTGRRGLALAVALLFVVHPMRVEAVAWISARKDVLSTALWLATTWLWVEWTRTRGKGLLVASLVAFVLGLGAKQMLMTLPLTLLVLDVWPLRRDLSLRARVVEKLPWFALSAAGAAVGYLSQAGGTSVTGFGVLGFGARLENVIVGYAAYLARLVRPVDLAYAYPHPSFVPPYDGWSTTAVVASAAVLVALTALAVVSYRRGHRAFAAGWAWYVITLLPVIGFVQIGMHANADRFSYVPHLGLILGTLGALVEALDTRAAWRRPAAGLAAALVVVTAGLTVRELPHWRDSESLFRRAIEVTDRNGVAMTGLGRHLARTGRADEAIVWLERAVEAQPLLPTAHTALGIVLANRRGEEERAVEHLEKGLEGRPEEVPAYVALGNVRARRGRLGAAVEAYRTAVRLDPTRWRAHLGLGRIARVRGNLDAARRHFDRALRVAPDASTRAIIRQRTR